MKKIALGILMMFLLAFGNAFGADSTCTQSIQGGGQYNVYVMVWTTDGSGDFTATATTQSIDGIVMLVEAIPSATAVPSDNYDLTLRNEQGIDVMGDSGPAGTESYDGSLANLDEAVPSQTQPLLNGNYTSVPVKGPLTLDVFNAGNAKSGTVRIHYLSIH